MTASSADRDPAVRRPGIPVLAVDLLPAPGFPVVLAVSGGADSLALWDLMARHGRWPLVIWHLDHGIRPPGDDLAVIRALVARHLQEGLPAVDVQAERADIPTLAAAWGVGLEEAGRRHRYTRLADVAAAAGAPVVATAHHQDDQAETVLMNLLRGAADTGLRGMEPRRTLPSGRMDAPPCDLVRPLLGVPRAHLRTYLQERGISWAEDPTNGDRRWRRNQMRHEVIPTLEAGVPGFTEALLRVAAVAQVRLQGDAAAVAAAWQADPGGGLRLAPILALTPAQRGLAWRKLLVQWSVHPDRRRIAALEDLAQGAPGRRYRIGTWLIRRRGRTLDWIPAPEPVRLS